MWYTVRFLSHLTYLIILQMEACMHPFFDELRDPNTRLPNGRPLPPLFNFRTQGIIAEWNSDNSIWTLAFADLILINLNIPKSLCLV